MSKIFDYEVEAGSPRVDLGASFTYVGATNSAKKGFAGSRTLDDADRVSAPVRLLFNDPNKEDVTSADKNLDQATATGQVGAPTDFQTSTGKATLEEAIESVFGSGVDTFDVLNLGSFSFDVDEKFTGAEFAIILEDRTSYTFDVAANGAVSNVKPAGHNVLGPSERQGRLAGRF